MTTGAVAARSAPQRFASQCLGEFLRRLERVDPHPAVLDLGVLCGDNIAFLASRGCRVSIESLPSAGAPEPSKAETSKDEKAPRSPLSHPPETFSGVLAWGAIARMPFEEAVGFVETLRRLLLDGGVILAYFPGPPGQVGSASGRYRILAEDRLSLEPAEHRRSTGQVFQNREIYALFSRFNVVRMSHLKSGTREVLVAKTPKRRSGRA